MLDSLERKHAEGIAIYIYEMKVFLQQLLIQTWEFRIIVSLIIADKPIIIINGRNQYLYNRFIMYSISSAWIHADR